MTIRITLYRSFFSVLSGCASAGGDETTLAKKTLPAQTVLTMIVRIKLFEVKNMQALCEKKITKSSNVMVRGAGIEPARPKAYAPQTYASASSATRAFKNVFEL